VAGRQREILEYSESIQLEGKNGSFLVRFCSTAPRKPSLNGRAIDELHVVAVFLTVE
jgi:hypothetical protein